MTNQPTFIEVSHAIEPGMKTYPGLPEPTAEVLLDYDSSRPRYNDQAEFMIASLHLCGNTGTYVDSPCHRYRDGLDLASLPLASLAHLPTIVVDATNQPQRGIGPDLFRDLEVRDKAVLVHTGWSRFWRTDRYFASNPFLTGEACDFLLAAGVRFVGIDSLNIDDIEDLSRPAHTPVGAFLHAVPIAWRGGATFPVRAYVMQFS
jgi:kynurenine formamidase